MITDFNQQMALVEAANKHLYRAAELADERDQLLSEHAKTMRAMANVANDAADLAEAALAKSDEYREELRAAAACLDAIATGVIPPGVPDVPDAQRTPPPAGTDPCSTPPCPHPARPRTAWRRFWDHMSFPGW